MDVFGGSAAVLLNCTPPYPVETYNDVNHDVVNFFRVLRTEPDALVEQLDKTPYAREEYRRACVTPSQDVTRLEQARLFFVRVRQSFNASPHTRREWSWARTDNWSRNGQAHTTSRWRGSVAMSGSGCAIRT